MADSSECLENVLCRRKGLQNKIEERAEESDEAAVRRERFVGSTFCIF